MSDDGRQGLGALSGSHATHEAPTGLRPAGFDPARKVVRDGKVAVLVSGGFGAGWYSWNTEYPALLFDSELVAAVEAKDNNAVLARAEKIAPDGYFGGSDGLYIQWVPQGSLFRIDEYDGSEGLVIQQDDDWIVA